MFYRLPWNYLLAALLSCAAMAAPPDPNGPAVPDKPLFNSDSVLELALQVDFDALCRPNREPDCDYVPATLFYTDPEGGQTGIPVELKVRGGWRARRDHCDVPPLFIRFSAEGTGGTPFAGQELLPLTTHCRDGRTRYGGAGARDYEQYVLREFLGYRLYNLVTPQSLRVRLARISYSAPGGGSGQYKRYAFFTEHFDQMAARNGGQRLSHGSFDYRDIDLAALDRVSLFNFMIGNTDSSVPRERNIVLIAPSSGPVFPVPYDLDMSGLVDAEYGGVSPRLDFRDPNRTTKRCLPCSVRSKSPAWRCWRIFPV
jgi:hypothetical protein